MNNLVSFLDNNSTFGRLMTRLGIIIVCNILFVLLSIPVVTIGAGYAAMYYTLMRTLRGDGVINPFKEFWKGLKSNFKQATIVWLAFLVLGGFLAVEWYWCGQFGGFFSTFRYALVVIGAAAALITIYMFPTMAAFEASIPQLIKNSIYFVFKKPLNLVIILFFNIFPMVLTYSDLKSLPLYAFIWVTIGFGLVGMLTSSLLLEEFKPFLPMVDICGDIIVNPEDEAYWADGSEETPTHSGSAPQKSEEEILEEMLKLGM